MGADQIITAMRAPHFTMAAAARLLGACGPECSWDNLVTTIAVRRIRKLERLAIEPSQFIEMYDWDKFEEFEDSDRITMKHVRRHLRRAVKQVLSGSREITSLTLGGKEYWLTGGMSWGDAPTDAYEPMCAVNEAGIFDRKITLTEVEQSLKKVST